MVQDYLYLWIKQKLKGIPEIKLIEMDFNQDDDRENNPITQHPCVLVSFSEADTEDLADGSQELLIDVELKLITVNYKHKDSRIREAGKISHFDIARSIYKLCHSLKEGMLSEIPEFNSLAGTNRDMCLVSTLRRVSANFDQTYSAKLRSSQVFTIRAIDHTAKDEFQKVAVPLRINEPCIL